MGQPFDLTGSRVVVTGAGSGIGRALAEHACHGGAAVVVLCDLDEDAARRAARGVDGGTARTVALGLDVRDESAVERTVATVEEELGPIDLWCSNAGVRRGAGIGTAADWAASLEVNLMAHLHVARHVLPRMLARRRGSLLVTASAAGLLTDVACAPYAVSKHGAVGLAEWLSIRHDADGIGVTCVCPQGVRTAMNADRRDDPEDADRLDPREVAADAFAALARGEFLCLPHPEVTDHERRRAGDRERWLAGMRRLAARSTPSPATGGIR